MSSPGVPPQLEIVDANGNGVLDPGEVRRTSDDIGSRARPIRRVRNLAVPGEDTRSVFAEISPGVIARRLVNGQSVDGRDVLKFLILGVPPGSGSVSQVTRARDVAPRFILLWLGANDVLDMAASTDPEAHTDVDEFGRRFRRLLNELADTGAAMAVANLPDVTGIAALRPATGEVSACRQADGTLRAVEPDDLISIDLPRARLPEPPCDDVLGPIERAEIRATVVAMNGEIAAAIADVEARRGIEIAPVDIFAFFDQIGAQAGADVSGDGVPDVTTAYLGGIFGLDGIHPTRTGNALLANAFIDAINRRFGETVPPVDVARVASRDPLVNNEFRPATVPPFGLIGDDAGNEIEGWWQKTADRIADRAELLAGDVGGAGRDFFNRFRRFFRDAF